LAETFLQATASGVPIRGVE